MDYSYWNFSALDCQFRNCGTLRPNVGDPWAPIIHRREPIKSPLESRVPSKNKPVLRVIYNLTGRSIDCAVEIIKQINSLPITRRKRALYYKVLFQETPKNYTLGEMYAMYYLERNTDMSLYTSLEQKFVYKCNYSDIPINEMYKWEYYKNTSRQ